MERENPEVDPTIFPGSQSIEFVVLGDPENTSIHFLLESFAEAVARLFIVGNGIKEFLLGLRQKFYDQVQHSTETA